MEKWHSAKFVFWLVWIKATREHSFWSAFYFNYSFLDSFPALGRRGRFLFLLEPLSHLLKLLQLVGAKRKDIRASERRVPVVFGD